VQTFASEPSTAAPAVVMKVNSHRRARPGEPQRRWSPFRVRDWRVPTKLAAVLVLPAVAFLVIAGVQINSSVATARQTESFARGIKVGRELTALVHDLQTERDRTAGVLAKAATTPSGEPVAVGAELTADYAATDGAFTAFFNVSKALSDASGVTAAGAKTISNDVAQLSLVRDGVHNRWLRQSAVFDQYSAMIQHLFDIVPADPDVGGDAGLKQSVASLADLAQVKELTAQLRGKIFAATTTGTFSARTLAWRRPVSSRSITTTRRPAATSSSTTSSPTVPSPTTTTCPRIAPTRR